MWVVLAGAAYAASALLGGCGHSVDVTPNRTEVCKDGSCLVLEPGHISYSQAQPETDVPPVVQPLKSKTMCKPLKEYLGVIRDYTREIVTFGGFVIAVFIYLDFREVVKEQATNAAHTAEILRTMDTRLQHLENYHQQQLKQRD